MKTVLLLYGVFTEEAVESVTSALEAVTGVEEVRMNTLLGEAVIVHDSSCKAAALVATVNALGFLAEPAHPRAPGGAGLAA